MSTIVLLVKMQRFLLVHQNRFNCSVLLHHSPDVFNDINHLSQLLSLYSLKSLRFLIFLNIPLVNSFKHVITMISDFQMTDLFKPELINDFASRRSFTFITSLQFNKRIMRNVMSCENHIET